MKKLITSIFTLAIALLFSAGMAFGQNITQIGDHNVGTVDKAGPVNNVDATIYQHGDLNNALMKPRFGAFNVSMNITQINGDNNNATLRLTTTSHNAYKIKQVGDRNDATMRVEQNSHSADSYILQLAGAAGMGFNNATVSIGDQHIHVQLVQRGRRNDASVDINGGSGLHRGEGSYVSLRQRGAFNSAENININTNTRLDIDQLGNNNSITSFTVDGGGVFGTHRQVIDLMQNGNWNTINMPMTVGSTGDINVTQIGNTNTATIK